MNIEYIEPSIEFLEAKNEEYLQFLERCTRTCYKSEHLIKEGSAEKLLDKVVNNYEHLSVTEHFNIVLQLSNSPHYSLGTINDRIIRANKLFISRYSYPITKPDAESDKLIISGNVRMFKELLDNLATCSDTLARDLGYTLESALSKKYRFFFHEAPGSNLAVTLFDVEILDSNFVTNKDNLDYESLLKHTTATFKFICSRTCSHQLVRHRLFAFSQESQRYVNYKKKGFQVIAPPGLDNLQGLFESSIEDSCDAYETLLAAGVKPEDARFVLPNAMKTEIVVTGTLNYWLYHIYRHRAENKHAQWEIRMLTRKATSIIRDKLGIF
jgi:thymidylate synthase (FAD)